MSEKVTFQELIESIADQTDHSRQQTHDFLKDFVSVINNGLEADGAVNIAGFGKFQLRPIKERDGINPKTGEKITIPAHNKVVFKPYKDLRELVNAPFAHLESTLIDEEANENEPDIENTVEEKEQDAPDLAAPVSRDTGAPAEDEPKSSPQDADTEKAPWEQALEDNSDENVNPEDPFGFDSMQESHSSFQFDDSDEEITDDGDIVEYSPGTDDHTEPKEMHSEPVSDTNDEREEESEADDIFGINRREADPEEMDQSEATGSQREEQVSEETTDSLNEEEKPDNLHEKDTVTPVAEPELAQPVLSSNPSDEEPGQNEVGSSSRKWMIAAGIVLLLSAGGWYFTGFSGGGSFNDLTIKSAQPADDRDQTAPDTDNQPVTASSDADQQVDTDANNEEADGSRETRRTESELTIAKGQTLWSLANQQYDDPYLWPWIYDENKNTISNPDRILAGQSLSLPAPGGSNGGLNAEDSLHVAIGYVETYRWYKARNYENAKYYLYAARMYNGNVFDHTDVNIDKADLTFANRVR